MNNKQLMCDDDVNVPAKYRYTWSWGEVGHCSESGRQRREQLAQNLARHIAFETLSETGPVPLELPERSRLAGQIYALTAENDDLRARGSKMYAELQQLRSDNRVLALRDAESVRQLKEVALERDVARGQLEALGRQNADLEEEAGLLRALTEGHAPS